METVKIYDKYELLLKLSNADNYCSHCPLARHGVIVPITSDFGNT